MDGQVYHWSPRRGVSWFGLTLVALGLLWLLDELGVIDFAWGIVWPILVIVVGLSMVVNRLLR